MKHHFLPDKTVIFKLCCSCDLSPSDRPPSLHSETLQMIEIKTCFSLNNVYLSPSDHYQLKRLLRG